MLIMLVPLTVVWGSVESSHSSSALNEDCRINGGPTTSKALSSLLSFGKEFGDRFQNSALDIFNNGKKIIWDDPKQYWGELGKEKLVKKIRKEYVDQNQMLQDYLRQNVIVESDLNKISQDAAKRILDDGIFGSDISSFDDLRARVELSGFKGAYTSSVIEKIILKELERNGVLGDLQGLAEKISGENKKCIDNARDGQEVIKCTSVLESNLATQIGGQRLEQGLLAFGKYAPAGDIKEKVEQTYRACASGWFKNKKERKGKDITACVVKSVLFAYRETSTAEAMKELNKIKTTSGKKLDDVTSKNIILDALNDPKVKDECKYIDGIVGKLSEDEINSRFVNTNDLATLGAELSGQCKAALTKSIGARIVAVSLTQDPGVLSSFKVVPQSFVDQILNVGYWPCISLQKEIEPQKCTGYVTLQAMKEISVKELESKLAGYGLGKKSSVISNYTDVCISKIEKKFLNDIEADVDSGSPEHAVVGCLEQAVADAGGEISKVELGKYLKSEGFTLQYHQKLSEAFGNKIATETTNCLRLQFVSKGKRRFNSILDFQKGVSLVVNSCTESVANKMRPEIFKSTLKLAMTEYYEKTVNAIFDNESSNAVEDASRLLLALEGSEKSGKGTPLDESTIKSIKKFSKDIVSCYKRFPEECQSLLNKAILDLSSKKNLTTKELTGLLIETELGRRLIAMETSAKLIDGIEVAGKRAGLNVSRMNLELLLDPVLLEKEFFNSSNKSWNKYRELIKKATIENVDPDSSVEIQQNLADTLFGDYYKYYDISGKKKDGVEIDTNNSSVKLIDGIMGTFIDAKLGEEVSKSIKGHFIIDGVVSQTIGGNLLSLEKYTTWDLIKPNGEGARKYFVDEFLYLGVSGNSSSSNEQEKNKKLTSEVKNAVLVSGAKGVGIVSIFKSVVGIPWAVASEFLEALSGTEISGQKTIDGGTGNQ